MLLTRWASNLLHVYILIAMGSYKIHPHVRMYMISCVTLLAPQKRSYKLSCSMTCAPLHSSPGPTTTGTRMDDGPVQRK